MTELFYEKIAPALQKELGAKYKTSGEMRNCMTAGNIDEVFNKVAKEVAPGVGVSPAEIVEMLTSDYEDEVDEIVDELADEMEVEEEIAEDDEIEWEIEEYERIAEKLDEESADN